jgi:hypothetical protein
MTLPLTELLTSALGFGIFVFQHNYLIINLQQVYYQQFRKFSVIFDINIEG